MENLRRIITGHNEDGKSIISIDGPPARTLGEDVGGLFEIWNTDGEQINSLDNKDRADIIPREKLEEATARAFELMGAAHERVDTSRHPAMHKTKTIDYIILLSGDDGNEPALLIAVLIDSDLKDKA